jgi:hypothetical protein
MADCHLRITVDGAAVFDAHMAVEDADPHYAQEQVDIYAWDNPGCRVVGELTGPQGERHLLYPAGQVTL